MKKFLFVALIFMMAFTVVYAQEAGQFTVGARGGIGIGFNDFSSEYKKLLPDDWNDHITLESLLHPVGAVYGYYTFAPNMAVQLEANIMINQGLKVIMDKTMSWDMFGYALEYTMEYSYMSIDIPVMFRYTFLNAPVSVGLAAGVNLSLPISKLNVATSVAGLSIPVAEIEMEGIGFGAVAGIFVGYPLGPGRIIGDVRFLLDFVHPKVKGDDDPMMNRRALNISVGYEMSF